MEKVADKEKLLMKKTSDQTLNLFIFTFIIMRLFLNLNNLIKLKNTELNPQFKKNKE